MASTSYLFIFFFFIFNKNMSSQLYSQLIEILGTAGIFKNTFSAYITIKRYIFGKYENLKSTNNLLLNNNEILEYNNQLQLFNQEISSFGNNVPYLSKENYELFLEQSFSSINFESCGRSTSQTAVNLIIVLSMYGEVKDKFLKIHSYLVQRINQMEQNLKLMNNKVEVNVTSSIDLSDKIKNVNVNVNSNNNVNSSKYPTNTYSPYTSDNNMILPGISKSNEDVSPSVIFSKMPSFCKRNDLKLPCKKGTPEYKLLKETIKEHLMYAEQEVLYNKLEYSQAHLEAAIYYLKNIEE
jgi:hypothetical protein